MISRAHMPCTQRRLPRNEPYRSTVAYYYYYSVEKVARGPDLLPYDNCVAISWQQADVHTQVPKHAKLPILYGYTEEQFGPLAHPCDRRKKMSDEATRRGMQALKESASGLQPALPGYRSRRRTDQNQTVCQRQTPKPKTQNPQQKTQENSGQAAHPSAAAAAAASRPPHQAAGSAVGVGHRPPSAHRSPYRAQPKQAWRACPGSHITWRGQGT